MYQANISSRFQKQHKIREKIAKRVFIVRAPRMLKYDEYDYQMGIPGKIVDGKARIANDEEMDVFGLSIISIAEAARDGFNISLYNKADFDRLWDLLKEFLEARDDRVNTINLSNSDDERYALLEEFAKGVVELNKEEFRQKGLAFNKFKKSIGLISQDEISKKVNERKQRKRSSDKVPGVIYPRPHIEY